MVIFPYSKNHQTGRSLSVSFYKTENIRNSKNAKQAKASDTADKEKNNKKEPKVKKSSEKKVPKRKSIKSKNSIKPDKDKIQDVSVTEGNFPDNKNKTEHVASRSKLSALTQIGSSNIKEESSFENEITTNYISMNLSGQNFAEKTIITNLPGIGLSFQDNKNILFNDSKLKENSWNEKEKKKYLEYVRRKIMGEIEYPSIAKRRGIEDKVLLSFNIRKDGTLENIKITKKSSYSILNNSVSKAVDNLFITEKPKENISVNIPVNFTLK